MFDLVIHGGQVMTPQGSVHADIGVEEGIIAAIGPELSGGKIASMRWATWCCRA